MVKEELKVKQLEIVWNLLIGFWNFGVVSYRVGKMLVELRGVEPLTYSMPLNRSPS